MKNVFVAILLTIICSLYYFPITLNALPMLNSKMFLAALGIVLFAWEHIIKNRTLSIRKEMLPVLLLGLLISLWSYYSVVYNNTSDFVFVTYFVSMSVWLGGAYVVIYLLRVVYGTVTYKLVFKYLVYVCTAQCVLALIIDHVPSFAMAVDSVIQQVSLEYFDKNPRIYGIGAAFDTAGIRFSCVLVAVAYLINNTRNEVERGIYIAAMVVISVVGNMISRTTVLGIVLALLYLMLANGSWLKAYITPKKILWVLGLFILSVVLYDLGSYMYAVNPGFREAFDYGFEGFINLFNTGEFATNSSDMLFRGLTSEGILPDNTKTWLIGDGWFNDPYSPVNFYAGTDSGYIVFIYYSGIIGLLMFVVYFTTSTYLLCKRDMNMILFFFCVLLLQFLVWIKIPTDLFCFYALLLLVDSPNKNIADNIVQENNELREIL